MSKNSYPPLDDFSVLLVNNNRSKAYLQNLIAEGHEPSSAVVLDTGVNPLPEHAGTDALIDTDHSLELMKSCPEAGVAFNEGEHILRTLQEHDISYHVCRTHSVNDASVIRAIDKCSGAYIVYSGPGGTILRTEILSCKKHMIHVHPGALPEYRGSTPIYFSLLANAPVTSTVTFLEQCLDTGPKFLSRQFILENTTDLDHVFDPAIRAASLLDFFNQNRGKEPVALHDEREARGNVFYIIHPVLKHAAILKISQHRKSLKPV
jgi:methionyl-tRNA formyltransferase